jgi:hypothetical protein
MAKYDPDRIAALAAGSLDPAEAAVLEAAIAADPRAAADLAAQRLALDAIHRAPAPLLSDTERTDLRRAVAAALHLEDSPAPAAATALASRRRVPWRPLAVAAAALTALVAAVPLFGLLSVGEEEAALTTIALSATTESQDFATAGADAPENLSAENGDATMLGTATTAAATTTVPPATLTRERIDAEETVGSLLADPARLFATEADGAITCLDEARILLQAPDPAGLQLTATEGGRDLVVWFLSSDGATVADLVAFDPDTCELLAVYP